MKIRHERPDADLAFSVRAPLMITLVDGKQVTVENWSLQGVTWPEDTDILPKAASLSVPFQGVDVQFPVRFTHGDGQNELLFADLTVRQRETLAVFYRSILSGRMAATEDMITALDTPVDLVPMGETAEEEAAGKAKTAARLPRIIWNLLIYTLAAVLIFGVIGGQVWSVLSTVSVPQGRVSAPMIAHHAPIAAHVDKIAVELGDRVKQGDLLVALNDPRRQGALDDLRTEIVAAEERREDAFEKLRAQRALIRQRSEALRHRYETSGAQYIDRAFQEWRAYADRRSERAKQDDALRVSLKDLLHDRERALSRLKRQRANLKDEIAALQIVALEDGWVAEIKAFKDQYIARGDLAVSVESATPRTFVGFADESYAGTLYAGMKARVRVSLETGPRVFTAEITEISAGQDPDMPSRYGMRITLAPTEVTPEKARDLLRPNTPVEIEALRPMRLIAPLLEWGQKHVGP